MAGWEIQGSGTLQLSWATFLHCVLFYCTMLMRRQMSPLVICSVATNKVFRKNTCEGGNLAITLTLLFILMQRQKKTLFIACQWLKMIRSWAASSNRKKKIRVKISKRKKMKR
jgi:hypothetical protein